ncbi:olfactory receptor 5B12-like [Trichosurus vulpecula]|uniref:olfactory receptor 5B12-like n=1 Tax=Trichosurus vulpecula TaxID=9337 RepID=UPI00186AC93C|nr:olfactory receptor 5B12-like [Trichosurus vulpecula]
MSSMKNRTEVSEFILTGISDTPELQVPLFIMFTIIYLIILVGNLGIVALISWDSCLHTPMYFFLSNLSLVDFGYSSAVTPKVIAEFLTGDKVISYKGCAAQMLFFSTFVTTEIYLLAVMAYDRYTAVCRPLHYTTTMTMSMCTCLTVIAHFSGFLNSAIVTGQTFSLSFCNSNVVHHFFCDIPPLLALSCSDVYTNEVIIFILGGFTVTFGLLFICISYLFIFIAILRIQSTEGRQKAFSTCASHLSVVSIFYGTIIFMYLQPSSTHSMETDKVTSVFYTMAIPMVNPLVYTLRNKEVHVAFRKAVWGQRLH